MSVTKAAVSLLLLASVTSAKYAESPVTKVVELIQDLKAKITAEGKAEQKTYDKFACCAKRQQP
jgi:hypothetical protein